MVRSTRIVFHLIGFRLIFQSLLQHILHIGYRSAFPRLSKFQRDKGIESHTAGTEERQFVDNAVVKLLYLAVVDNLDSATHIERYSQMPSQSVAGSTGYDGHCRLSMHQRPSHLVDRSVASNSHHNINPICCRLTGHFRCMSGIFRHPNLMFIQIIVQ